MSAEVLRRAAALMRENAEAATPDICPEWTRSAVRHVARNCDIECWHEDGDPLLDSVVHDDDASWNTWDRYKDAPHIASWHPAVALTVARLLDDTAETWEMCDQDADFRAAVHTIAVGYTREHALKLARTYLGESS